MSAIGPHYLERLLSPESIAIVGASEREGSLGRLVFENVLAGGFKGAVYPVNPKHDEILGHRAYASVGEIGHRVDVAVVVAPAPAVAAIIDLCGEASVAGAVVITAGFREVGAEGLRREQAVLDAARRHGMRIIGPNCVGIIRPSIGLNATFSQQSALPGSLALVSQSGAVCTAILDWAPQHHVGFSAVVSLGIGADVGFGDTLDYLALDPETDSILLYVEGVRDARQFMSGLRAAARIKPVIVVKSGRHAAGAKAAVSHTGALVGSDDAFDAALRRAGAVRVFELDALFSAAEALAGDRPVRGERLCVVTNAGGLGVLAADRAADLNLPLTDLDAKTIERLDAEMPPTWSRGNPIDIIGDAPPQRYSAAVAAALDDPGVDGLLVMLAPQAMTHPTSAAQEVVNAAEGSTKPVLTCWMGGESVEEGRDLLVRAGLPHFDTPEAAVESFSALASYHRNQKLLLQTPEPGTANDPPDIDGARLIIEHVLAEGRSVLTLAESKAVLSAFRIPTVPSAEARDANEALVIAETVGFPVAMKIASADITHKSDVGGVRLGIQSAHEVRGAFNDIIATVRRHHPDAAIDGVSVERMHRPDNSREVICGITSDEAFGPVITFGAGGTQVELTRDRAVALPPINRPLARDLIEQTRIARLLGPFRGMPPANLGAIEDVLLRVSEIAAELPEVRELDINPLVVDEHRAVAVDARIAVAHAPAAMRPYAHLAIHPYPRDLATRWQLADGTDITIRPIRPEDAAIEGDFVRRLSTQSRYFRFRHALRELTPAMLTRFTQIDYDREMALIATIVESGATRQIGVARYVANPDGRSCEFAVVVADEWQGRGLGGRLIQRLIAIARQRGLETIVGEVVADNGPMLDLMRVLGFSIEHDPEESEIMIVSHRLQDR